ncbi:hypothetical protein BCR22_03165 [Enterococcus plantarum]|uniref:helix-turn-helix domain-containing protein n=1 Tax=Enterococcus plantarum TaxID=1077675 RepID=UPI00084CEB06|nr:helix-turn-helix transcriptional regulator [Enterococcus plantarum]MBO0466734.1 helix-turn-helix transcriptional regulator [Enterococcus plantarum]OEG13256.1 hypothetical protein BCR22_03165 [Enterococcus plantarum]
MQSLTDGETLKKLRKLRRLNQKECCQGIISRHTYSRIERNQTSIQFHVLLELLERLNISFEDFLFFKKEMNPPIFSRKKLFDLTIETFQESEGVELYSYLEQNKQKNMQNFHHYLLYKQKMEQLDFENSEKINLHDLNILNSYITKLSFFSILDLTLFSDMCSYLTYDIMKTASLKIVKQIKNIMNRPDTKLIYQQKLHLTLYTVTSVALENEDYNFVKHLLGITRDFLDCFPNHHYLVFLHCNTHTLNYKLTTNNYYLSKLFILKDYMKEVEDYQTVDKIEKQIKLLIQHTASIP